MFDINLIKEQIKAIPVKKKILLLVVIASVITSLILFFAWVQRADYQILYSNLTEEDAASIIQKLKELKVPYKTSSGTVMVPSDKVYDVRLQLASQGLPQGGGVGFELFDKTSFTMTDFVQKLNYRRALQGELARTIRSLSEVDQCRVHLAVPEKSLFMTEEERPKASVLVKLKQGRSLSQSQVQGIVHLVSSSVEGLDPKDVAVVDSRGEMLTSAMEGSFGITNTQREYQQNIEKDLENRIIGILEPVVGRGKVKAKVSAEIDFTKIEKTEEKFDPDSQVARSEQKIVEKTTNGNKGGVPGVSSNLPAKPATPTSLSQMQSEKKSETINYEISKVTSHIINPSGEIKRQSAVVLVDGTYTAQQGSTEKKYTPRTSEEISQFEDMVKKAIGFKAERGDEVRVVNMPFETTLQEDLSEPKREVIPYLIRLAKYIVPLIALVLVFLFVIKPLMKALTSSPLTQSAQLSLPKTVSEIERTMEIEKRPGVDGFIEWTKKNPKEASNLIRNWIEEE
ncbi:MAG: flagellar basal-body MS-ring/collar protein FliF [Thermodesulfovibrionales bacterium]